MGFLATWQNLEKANDIIPRKHAKTDKRLEGQTEGQMEGWTNPIL